MATLDNHICVAIASSSFLLLQFLAQLPSSSTRACPRRPPTTTVRFYQYLFVALRGGSSNWLQESSSRATRAILKEGRLLPFLPFKSKAPSLIASPIGLLLIASILFASIQAIVLPGYAHSRWRDGGFARSGLLNVHLDWSGWLRRSRWLQIACCLRDSIGSSA